MEKKPFIPKEGKGRLFENRRREGNQPHWRGDAMVNGVHVQISGWDQDDGSISLSIQRKEERANQQQRETGFQQMRQAVDRNVSDVPLPGVPQDDGSDVPF